MYILNNREKAYLRGIVINTRNEYLKKEIYEKYEEIGIEENFEQISYDENCINDIIEQLSNENIVSFNIEKVFTNVKIMKIVRALTLREKLVLFSYYFENKTDKAIGTAIHISTEGARIIRKNALKKIKERYLGGNSNV